MLLPRQAGKMKHQSQGNKGSPTANLGRGAKEDVDRDLILWFEA